MKCKLVFCCALVSCLKYVASFPSAFNVPKYPIPKNDLKSREPYDHIGQQPYWDHQLYNDDRYRYPQDYRNTNHDPNLPNRNKDYVPNYGIRNNRRHPVQQKFPNSFPRRPIPNKWPNFNHQPAGRYPDEALTVTLKPYYNDRDSDKQIHNKYVTDVPIAKKPKPFYPSIPQVPPKTTTPAKLSSPKKYLPVIKPIKTKDEKVASGPLPPDRFFATSANPVETYPDFDPNRNSKKNIIRHLMSNSKIRNMIGKSKTPSRYLVVYPNGTMERVNTLQPIAKRHPNYVLVHAGDLVVKENSNIDPITETATNFEQVVVTTPRTRLSNETKPQNDNITTTEKVPTETSTITPKLLSNTLTLPNKVLLKEPKPKFVRQKIEPVQPPKKTDATENSTTEIDKQSDTPPVSTVNPITEDYEEPEGSDEKIMTLDIPPRTMVKVSLSDDPALPNIEEIPLDTNTTDAPLLVKPPSSELDMPIKLTKIVPAAVPSNKETTDTETLPSPMASFVEPTTPTQPNVTISRSKPPIKQMALATPQTQPNAEISESKPPIKLMALATPQTQPNATTTESTPPVKLMTLAAPQTQPNATITESKPPIKLMSLATPQTQPNATITEPKPPIKLIALATSQTQPNTTITESKPPIKLMALETPQTEPNVTIAESKPPIKLLALAAPQTQPNVTIAESKPPIKQSALATPQTQPNATLTEAKPPIKQITTAIAPDDTILPIIPIEDKKSNMTNEDVVPSTPPKQILQDVPKELRANDDVRDLPVFPSIPITDVTTNVPVKAPNVEENNVTTTVLPTIDKTPAPLETVVQSPTLASTTETNDLTVLPGPMNSILINAPENHNLTRLPGQLDISKVNTVEKPIVLFKSNDESFWNKLGDGNDDLNIDILYFFQINSPPKIENSVTRTIYPNGTITEEVTRSVWTSNSDKPTVTKTRNVINPND